VTANRPALVRANDSDPTLADDSDEILRGLSAPQKHLSPKYFYDETGSRLFDEICTLQEYYPTCTERAIMGTYLGEMAALIGPRAAVIELGSGSSQKIRQLLDGLDDPVAYVPVDISEDYLSSMANAVARDYPQLQVLPVYADFTRPFELPAYTQAPARNLVFFPGSTIGNFERGDAASLLGVMRIEAGPGGALLIGVDRKKHPEILHAAYNDASGVTAAFNLNVLRRLNNELGACFDLTKFRHEAIYDEAQGRIEMRLVSRVAQRIAVAGRMFEFRAGEYIVTEYSHKYADDEFAALAASAGWRPEKVWRDDADLFGVHYLTVAD
jgi:L-histidine N-alpha-methyltransferase